MKLVEKLLVLAAALVCTSSASFADDMKKLVFMTDWKAQAEHGGFYAAKALGLYEERGLEVDLRSGGPSQNIQQLLAAGAIDLASGTNNFFPLNLIQAGADVKAVAAIFQKDPAALIVHEDSSINSVEDMKGHPIFVSTASLSSNFVYLKEKLGFTDAQVRPYSFNLGPFLSDKESIQQGYLSSEPFIAAKEGFKTRIFLLSDHGYPSYASLILARGDLVQRDPKAVQDFVDASIEGWYAYLYGDPTAANDLIKRDNPEMDDETIAYGRAKLLEYGIIDSGDASSLGIGAMTDTRWAAFFDLMSKGRVYDPSLDFKKAYTLEFVNKNHGAQLKKNPAGK